MGKKARAKIIRRQVADLPVINIKSHENHIVSGAEFLTQGRTEIDGQKVEVHKVYIDPIPVISPINHSRRLRKLVNKYGEAVIPVYKEAMQQSQQQ